MKKGSHLTELLRHRKEEKPKKKTYNFTITPAVCERFSATCGVIGESMSTVIEAFMADFAEDPEILLTPTEADMLAVGIREIPTAETATAEDLAMARAKAAVRRLQRATGTEDEE